MSYWGHTSRTLELIWVSVSVPISPLTFGHKSESQTEVKTQQGGHLLTTGITWIPPLALHVVPQTLLGVTPEL